MTRIEFWDIIKVAKGAAGADQEKLHDHLEPLKIPHDTTKPPPTDDNLREGQKGLMNIIAFVEPHLQPAELMHQRFGLLDHPADDPQPAAVFRFAFGQERLDPSVPEFAAVRFAVVCAVGVGFVGPELRGTHLAPDRRDCIDQRKQLRDVVLIGAGECGRQRRAVGVDRQVVFGAGFGPVHRIRPRFFPPCIARTEVESTTTLSRSRASHRRRWSSSTACNSPHTSALVHSSMRFHNVIPQQPISQGKSSQGMPDLSTKRIPVRHTRSLTRGRPPLGLGSCFGSSGSTNSHNSSVTSGLDIASSVNKAAVRHSIGVPKGALI
jgi:hypothetical protein